jgi:putative ABC transport system permease protein
MRPTAKIVAASFSNAPLGSCVRIPLFADAALSDRYRMTFAPVGQYEVDGRTYVTDHDRPRGNYESVSDHYFSTLGLKILEGRDFTIDDADTKQPVAIVNASFARKHWGNQSALGDQVRIFNPGQPQPWRTIIGVVPDMLMQGPFDQQDDTAGFYTPLLGESPLTQFCTMSFDHAPATVRTRLVLY